MSRTALTFEEDNIIKSRPSEEPIETCPFKNGFKRIDIQAFMADQHLLSDRPLAMRSMIAAWASMLNLGRKGEAKTLREMGQNAFGKEEFKRALQQCLEQ